MRAQSAVWMEIAEDDIEAAEHCFHGNRWLWVMFMCQQAVEKAIKAIYFENTGEMTRYPDKRTALEDKCTQEYTKEMMECTKGAMEWLKSKLK